MTDAVAHAEDHPGTNYMAKFWWLVGLTAAEVAAAVLFIKFFPGATGLKLLVLGAFAIWKAGVVLNHFMHMSHEGKALKLMMCFPLVLIAILVTLFVTDGVWLHYAAE